MVDLTTVIAAASMGLLGSTHCFSMCGGIAGALSIQTDTTNNQLTNNNRFIYTLLYSVGRISSYGMAGFLMGSIGFVLSDTIGTYASLSLRIFAGLLVITLGLSIAGWWHGLARIEQLGGLAWKKISPITTAFLPVDSPWKAIMIGCLWGWLPCGLVYSALVWASASSNPVHSAISMISFGLGTLPAVLSSGILAKQLSSIIRNQWIRQISGTLLILFGIWTGFVAVQHTFHHNNHDTHSHRLDTTNDQANETKEHHHQQH